MTPRLKHVSNHLTKTYWNLESGYANETNEQEYPIRVFDSGRNTALEISLEIHEKDFELFCDQTEQGFNVYLNTPGDEMGSFQDRFLLPLLYESIITMKPKLTTTSKALRKYDPNHKKCFFDSERKLRFFKHYTQNNCDEECLANFTQILCGCAKFSQPSKYELKMKINKITV